MPSFLLIAPALILCFLTYYFVGDRNLAIMMIFGLVGYMSIIYVLHAQINQWYYRRFPPKVTPPQRALLQKFVPYYQALNEEGKRVFESKLAIFADDKAFISKELPGVPPDVRTIVCAAAAQVIFGLKDFYLDYWGHVILYQQPFFSPQNHRPHSGELEYEDGCVLLAIDPLMKGVARPDLGYNIGLHYFGLAIQFEKKVEEKDFFLLDEVEGDDEYLYFLTCLCKIRERPNWFEKEYLAVPREELFGVCVEHFFNASKNFKDQLPRVYQALVKILQQDPLRMPNPLTRTLAS